MMISYQFIYLYNSIIVWDKFLCPLFLSFQVNLRSSYLIIGASINHSCNFVYYLENGELVGRCQASEDPSTEIWKQVSRGTTKRLSRRVRRWLGKQAAPSWRKRPFKSHWGAAPDAPRKAMTHSPLDVICG